MSKQSDFLLNRGDEESITVGVGGQGEKNSEGQGREGEGCLCLLLPRRRNGLGYKFCLFSCFLRSSDIGLPKLKLQFLL